MNLDRITNLSAPPVVGKHYLVPTVYWLWEGYTPRHWPVFLPKHSDARFFNFADEHYHPDPRFIWADAWRSMSRPGFFEPRGGDAAALNLCQRRPLATHRFGDFAKPLPEVTWRPMTCKRLAAAYQHGDKPGVAEIRQHYAGQTCKRARSGWVCPHQHVPMGSLEADEAGVLTCPLHGLRIRAADGVVLSEAA